MLLNDDEKSWLAIHISRCKVCGHLNVFHVRNSDSCCIVGECSCDGIHVSIDAANEERLKAHLRGLENLEYRDQPRHVDACSTCQEHLAKTNNSELREYYDTAYKEYKRSRIVALIYELNAWPALTKEEHIVALESLVFPKSSGHVDQCETCQVHITNGNASDAVYDFYNYARVRSGVCDNLLFNKS